MSCCGVQTPRRFRRGVLVRRGRDAVGVTVPAVVFVLIPKCPACLAAYIAVWTGLGVSVTGATYVRMGLLALCVASAVFWLVVVARRVIRRGAATNRV